MQIPWFFPVITVLVMIVLVAIDYYKKMDELEAEKSSKDVIKK